MQESLSPETGEQTSNLAAKPILRELSGRTRHPPTTGLWLWISKVWPFFMLTRRSGSSLRGGDSLNLKTAPTVEPPVKAEHATLKGTPILQGHDQARRRPGRRADRPLEGIRNHMCVRNDRPIRIKYEPAPAAPSAIAAIAVRKHRAVSVAERAARGRLHRYVYNRRRCLRGGVGDEVGPQGHCRRVLKGVCSC